MKVLFSNQGMEDYLYWSETDRKVFRRLNNIIKECRRTPFEGTGKPEPLKGVDGWWSRRLNERDRIVYRVSGKGDAQHVEIAQCRFHYS